MLISDYYLEEARVRAKHAAERPYVASMESEPPLMTRVRVQMTQVPEMVAVGQRIGASLFVLDTDAASLDAASPSGAYDDLNALLFRSRVPGSSRDGGLELSEDGQSRERSVDDSGGRHFPQVTDSEALSAFGDDAGKMDQWREVENLYVTNTGVCDFTFAHEFPTSTRPRVRVEFYLIEVNARGEQIEKDVGHAIATLEDIMTAPNERYETGLISMDHTQRVGWVTAGLVWVRDPNAKLAFDIRIRVNRKNGWPFSSRRMFYMLYKMEHDGQWTPLYLSEVRDRENRGEHPDDSDRALRFIVAEVSEQAICGGNDSRPLRIEFFHYKTSHRHHNLIAYVTVSAQQLRQLKENAPLDIQTNTFPNTELGGRLRLCTSQHSSVRSYFQLTAEFGGEVDGRVVYVEFALTCMNNRFRHLTGGKSPLSRTKPFYQISRAHHGTAPWNLVYRSEMSSKFPGSNMYKFQLAKISDLKLTRGDSNKELIISLHSSRTSRICSARTSMHELLTMSNGSVLPVTFSAVGGTGYIRLERREVTGQQTFISLQCVLGQPVSPDFDSDGESAVVEIGDLPSQDHSDGSESDDNCLPLTTSATTVTPTALEDESP